MTNGTLVLKGVVHGKTIELEREPGIAEGQTVSVSIDVASSLPEGLLRAFGSCADEADALDGFVRETYQLRDLERQAEIERQARPES